MRITGEQSDLATRVGAVSGVSASQDASNAELTTAATSETSAATVTFSSQAQVISRATAVVNSLPDTRDDLVASLKAKVDAGTYHVSGSDIADMMMRRQTADNAD